MDKVDRYPHPVTEAIHRNAILKLSWFKYIIHYETIPIQIYWKNLDKKKQKTRYNFQIKNSDIFNVSAQNRDCGYSLEPPW